MGGITVGVTIQVRGVFIIYAATSSQLTADSYLHVSGGFVCLHEDDEAKEA